jgi:hypothetical protein
MDQKKLDALIDQVSQDLSYVIRELGRRGVSDSEINADDFQMLLLRKEFRDLVVGELYEAYFLPERHESDWQLLHELVAVLTSERIREFVATTVVAGVIGNSAFAVLRSVIARITTEMKKAKLPSSKLRPFQGMRDDVEHIEKYFQTNECVRIADMESSTGIPRERIYPLLKLLGFTHYRRQHACHWCKPGATMKQGF